MRIPKRSPVSLIFFLIYISEVFDKVAESNQVIIFLSFIDDLVFIAFGYLNKELAKILGDVGRCNAVTYNIAKKKAMLFSKSYCLQLNKQMVEVTIKIRVKNIEFNNKATQWLGI